MKKNIGQHFGKIAMSSALVLALSVPVAAAANAATVTTTPVTSVSYTLNTAQLSKLASQFNIDWNAILQQIQNGSGNAYTVPVTTTPTTSKPVTTTPVTTKPVTTTPVTTKPVTTTPTTTTKPSTGSGTVNTGTSSNETVSDFAAQVVNLVNQERSKAGLSSLSSDTKLTTVAVAKAKDMYTNNYFDHNSPTYGSPFDMMKQYGVTYSYAGENIAKGQQNPTEVMTAWMNSAGHKANILNANFKSIGVAYYNGEWVQEFTG